MLWLVIGFAYVALVLICVASLTIQSFAQGDELFAAYGIALFIMIGNKAGAWLRRQAQGLKTGFNCCYLTLERFVGDQIVATIPWNQVRVVENVATSYFSLSPEASLETYGPDGDLIGDLGSVSPHRHGKDLLAFVILRCGSYELGPGLEPGRAATLRRGGIHLAIAALLLLSALPGVMLTITQAESFSIYRLLASFVAIVGIFYAVSGTSLVFPKLLPGRRREEGSPAQNYAFRSVPRRIEMEPGLWYVYRNCDINLKGTLFGAFFGSFLFFAVLMLLQGDRPLIFQLLAAAGIASCCAFTVVGLTAGRVRHRFKLEGEHLVVDTGRRQLRFPAMPKDKWPGGSRVSSWMGAFDTYGNFWRGYSIDPCYLVEEEEYVREKEQAAAGQLPSQASSQ